MTLGHLGRACARRGRCYYGLFTCGEILVPPRFVLHDAAPPLPLGLALLCYLVRSSVSPLLGAPFCHFLTFRAVSSSKNVLRFISSNIHRRPSFSRFILIEIGWFCAHHHLVVFSSFRYLVALSSCAIYLLDGISFSCINFTFIIAHSTLL